MGICDLPALSALIQKRLPFFKKRETWELGGYKTGSANTAPKVVNIFLLHLLLQFRPSDGQKAEQECILIEDHVIPSQQCIE
jgi:hypothetical protein